VLIRPSGTEPLVRVMVESRDGDQARRCAERLADIFRA
jgi:phosphoglucosamine mutase